MKLVEILKSVGFHPPAIFSDAALPSSLEAKAVEPALDESEEIEDRRRLEDDDAGVGGP